MNTQLSFDGFGINDTDEYRTRLATFAQSVPDDRRQELARLWIAAPELLDALKSLLQHSPTPERVKKDFSYILHREFARRIINKAEGKDTPS